MRCTHCDIAFNTVGMYHHHMKKYHDFSGEGNMKKQIKYFAYLMDFVLNVKICTF